MSLSGTFPVTVVMERRRSTHPWVDDSFGVAEVLAGPAQAGPALAGERYAVAGLQLELHDDDGEGYYENWAAPEPRVFVLWRLQQGRAEPARVSVSYSEGTRMMDSGEAADGLPMPPEIHAWLGHWLLLHHRPRARRQRS